MKNTTAFRAAVFALQDLDRFRFGFARVNDDGHFAFAGGTQLSFESLDLHVLRRVVVMKVETNLAPRDYASGSVEELGDLFFRSVVVMAGVVRMNADCGVDVRVPAAHLDRAFEDAAMRIAGADVQDYLDAGFLRAFEHLI